MRRTFMITGASGGMFGAAYFRALASAKADPSLAPRDLGLVNMQDRKWVDDISGDLLNPLFSSFVARDMASPVQKFKVGSYEYVKDRGYAFEQKLNINTRGLLNRQLRDLAADEREARMPLMLFNPSLHAIAGPWWSAPSPSAF